MATSWNGSAEAWTFPCLPAFIPVLHSRQLVPQCRGSRHPPQELTTTAGSHNDMRRLSLSMRPYMMARPWSAERQPMKHIESLVGHTVCFQMIRAWRRRRTWGRRSIVASPCPACQGWTFCTLPAVPDCGASIKGKLYTSAWSRSLIDSPIRKHHFGDQLVACRGSSQKELCSSTNSAALSRGTTLRNCEETDEHLCLKCRLPVHHVAPNLFADRQSDEAGQRGCCSGNMSPYHHMQTGTRSFADKLEGLLMPAPFYRRGP